MSSNDSDICVCMIRALEFGMVIRQLTCASSIPEENSDQHNACHVLDADHAHDDGSAHNRCRSHGDRYTNGVSDEARGEPTKQGTEVQNDEL